MDKKSSLREKYKASVKQRKEELLIGLRPQDKKAVENIKQKK